MRSFIAVVLLVTLFGGPYPDNVFAQETHYLDVVLLIPEDGAIDVPAGCTFNSNPRSVLMQINQIPYQQEQEKFFEEGRRVSGSASPIQDFRGCLLERTFVVQQADSFLVTMSLPGSSEGDIYLDLGEISWTDYISVSPDPFVYVLDADVMTSGSGHLWNLAPEDTQTGAPDYVATIEAQRAEIASLEATIEAHESGQGDPIGELSAMLNINLVGTGWEATGDKTCNPTDLDGVFEGAEVIVTDLEGNTVGHGKFEAGRQVNQRCMISAELHLAQSDYYYISVGEWKDFEFDIDYLERNEWAVNLVKVN